VAQRLGVNGGVDRTRHGLQLSVKREARREAENAHARAFDFDTGVRDITHARVGDQHAAWFAGSQFFY
jgi:hypothetical protein